MPTTLMFLEKLRGVMPVLYDSTTTQQLQVQQQQQQQQQMMEEEQQAGVDQLAQFPCEWSASWSVIRAILFMQANTLVVRLWFIGWLHITVQTYVTKPTGWVASLWYFHIHMTSERSGVWQPNHRLSYSQFSLPITFQMDVWLFWLPSTLSSDTWSIAYMVNFV